MSRVWETSRQAEAGAARCAKACAAELDNAKDQLEDMKAAAAQRIVQLHQV